MVSELLDHRGQVHTIEAFIGAVILISALVFSLQATAITSQTPSTANQYVEAQEQKLAQGFLDAASENGSLRESVLYWNDSTGRFYRAQQGTYYSGHGPVGTQFGTMLNRTFDEKGVGFNVNIWYLASDGDLKRVRMVYFGTPGDDAVSASRTLTVYDDDELTAPGGQIPLSDAQEFYAPDSFSSTGLYNVLRVEVVVWHR